MLGEIIEPQPPISIKKRHAPKKHKCPVCGKTAKRERTRAFSVFHLAHRRQCIWEVTVGVYKARCSCTRTIRRKVNGQWVEITKPLKYFTSTVPGLEVGETYTQAVREKVVDLVIRDRMSNLNVIEHMREEHCLNISEGFIYTCLDWAQKKKGLPLIRTGYGVSRTSLVSSA